MTLEAYIVITHRGERWFSSIFDAGSYGVHLTNCGVEWIMLDAVTRKPLP